MGGILSTEPCLPQLVSFSVAGRARSLARIGATSHLLGHIIKNCKTEARLFSPAGAEGPNHNRNARVKRGSSNQKPVRKRVGFVFASFRRCWCWDKAAFGPVGFGSDSPFIVPPVPSPKANMEPAQGSPYKEMLFVLFSEPLRLCSCGQRSQVLGRWGETKQGSQQAEHMPEPCSVTPFHLFGSQTQKKDLRLCVDIAGSLDLYCDLRYRG